MSIPDFLGSDPYRTATALEALARDLRRLAGGEAPDLRSVPVLRNWRPASRFQMALEGIAHGHPLIVEGRLAITSEVFALATDRSWARTLSRFYALENPIEEQRNG